MKAVFIATLGDANACWFDSNGCTIILCSIEMKRILVFIDSLTSGGAQRQNVGLAKLLHDNGYEVKLVYYHPIEFYKPFLDENGVDNELIPDAIDGKKRIFRVAKAMNAYKPDVVISYLDVPNILACMLKACGMKYKLITSERNTTQVLAKKEKLKFFLMRWADAIVPNSYSQEHFIKEHYPNLMNKVHTITNFVDTDAFSPVDSECSDTCRFICVGRVSEQKNTLRFLQVIKRLKDNRYNFKIEWFGYVAESYLEQCNEYIAQNKLQSVFSFNEPTSTIVDEYRKNDVFILPSIYEGFPNVVCEAMCCGKPILCSNICDNPLIVEDGGNGFLFDPLSTDDMYEKMEKFIRLPLDEKHKMSLRSRELALKKFSSEAFIQKYITLIEQ